MAGPNINKRQMQQAAGGIGFEGVAPIQAEGVGLVGTGPTGATVAFQDPSTRRRAGILDTIAAEAGEATTIPGQGDFSATALGQAQQMFEEAGAFDPLDAAEKRFQRLQSVLAPRREQSKAALDAKLFAQGRLDSTAGSRESQAQQEAFASADAQLLDQLVSSSEASRRAELQGATNIGVAGANVGQGVTQQALKGAEGATAQGQNILQLLQQGTNIGAAQTEAEIARANAIAQSNQVIQGQGGSGIGSTIGGVLGGAAGFVAGGMNPVTGAAGAKAGAGIGSLFD